MSKKMKPDIRREIAEIAKKNTEVRRDLHANPQTGFEETYAHGVITSILDDLNIEYEVMAETGVVATIESKNNTSGKTIGIRVDIDALDIEETSSGMWWTSQNPGKMHACGHDGHTTIGLTTAEYLAINRDKFNGTVKVVFQPAEEGMGGAKRMIKEGLFKKHPMSSIYAIHNNPMDDLGNASVNRGPVSAGNSNFEIKVKGKSSHGAYPEQGLNPIPIASSLVDQLGKLEGEFQKADKSEKFVLSVCSFEAGTSSAKNAIPDQVLMTGTIRTHNPVVAEKARARVKEIANAAMRQSGADIEIEWPNTCRPAKNTEANANLSYKTLTKMLGRNRVARDVEPTMGSEDFGEYVGKPLSNGEKVAASYIRLGQRDPKNPNGPSGKGLHNSGYDYNDDLTPIGAEYMTRIVEAELPLDP